jgi:hypothetical protein
MGQVSSASYRNILTNNISLNVLFRVRVPVGPTIFTFPFSPDQTLPPMQWVSVALSTGGKTAGV